MATGFFRTTVTQKDGKDYFKYQVRNRLVHKELMAKDIKKLKEKVEANGLLWGIIDKEQAEQHSGDYKLKALQGTYGIRVDEDE